MSDPTETQRASWYGPEGTVDPYEYGRQHGLNPIEVAIIKYITRWRKKGGGWTKSVRKVNFLSERLVREAGEGLHGPDPNV